MAYCTVSYVVAGDFFLSHTGVTSFYGRAGGRRGLRHAQAAVRRAGDVPDPGPAGPGAGLAGVPAGSPIRPYYANLPRAETDSLISDFNHRVLTQQPLRVLGAYTRDVVKLFALTRDDQPGRHADLPLAVPDHYPYFPPGLDRRR